MSSHALEIRDLTVTLRGTPVLEGIDLELEPGGFLGIIGPNGGGKTTLLKAVLGLIQPDRGSVRIFGESPEEARGQVVYVPQHTRFDLSFPIRVLDVVLMGRLHRGGVLKRLDRQDRERAQGALEEVRLGDLAGRQIGKLSGGQLQRVLVARALASDARLLLLDEPTASLDPGIGRGLYELLEGLTPKRTVVIVSHDIGAMTAHVQSLACLNRRLVYHAPKELSREMLEATYGAPVSLLLQHAAHTHNLEDGGPPHV